MRNQEERRGKAYPSILIAGPEYLKRTIPVGWDQERSDAENLAKLGKILAVSKIVAGSVGRVGDTYNLTLRMVDVETGKIDAFVSEDVKAERDALLVAVRNLSKRLAFDFAKEDRKR